MSKSNENCQYCGGTGVVDSGGVTPWGDGIDISCQCQLKADSKVKKTAVVIITDLWADEGGWSGNYSWVRKFEFTYEDGESDLAIARRAKKAANIQGMRKDGWAGTEFSWRDGAVGAYVEFNDWR